MGDEKFKTSRIVVKQLYIVRGGEEGKLWRMGNVSDDTCHTDTLEEYFGDSGDLGGDVRGNVGEPDPSSS